jgi:hypothetical protein
MSGFRKLTDEIRMEMLLDARDESRRAAFREARRHNETCDLDTYIGFLAEAMEWVKPEPAPRRTSDFRL